MTTSKARAEIDDLFDELDQLLKNPDVGGELAEAGVNISLAIVAADGLRAYLRGEKEKAAEELETAAEEIRVRIEASRELAKGKPS
jgi:CHASE3 domain sensor protein